MTQKELAAMLGVTPATVSKAVKNAPDISAATRARVLAAMEEQGMKIDRERRTQGRAVLVVTPEFGSEYYAKTLSCLHDALSERGLTMLTMSLEQDYNLNIESVRRILHTMPGICGVIMLDSSKPVELGKPSVAYSNNGDVRSDFKHSMEKAIRHLLAAGRRRIAYVGEQLTRDKNRSFYDLMTKLVQGFDEHYLYVSRLRFEQAGADGFAALFSLPEPPDAIICGYDYIALGVLNAAEAAGIEVPRELAVIGADNERAAAAYRLGLSTIGINHAAVADALVELLLWRIDHPDAPERQITVPSELYLRGTT